MASKQKWRNRVLKRGVVIDRARGYVYVRFKRNGEVRKELIGRTTEPEAIDRANFRAEQLRTAQRAGLPGFETKRQRMLVEDAAELFFKLHCVKRESAIGIKQFVRYVRLIKEKWSGRYVDTITPDDLRDYRAWRRTGGGSKAGRKCAAESTINREHTAIVTMFNRLVEWRRSGRISKSILLPEDNPGKGVRKVSEDRFIRDRLLSDDEFRRLWENADARLRRIIAAAMNLPLRLEDLKRLRKSQVNERLSQFRGVQAKTGREYTLPINSALWSIIRSAPGETILDFTAFPHRWKQAVRRAGLKGLQFRDIRRTAATALHDNGVPLRTISSMLGHTDVTTTIRYLGLKEENLRMAGDLLASKFGGVDVMSALESVPQSVPTAPSSLSNENNDSYSNLDMISRV